MLAHDIIPRLSRHNVVLSDIRGGGIPGHGSALPLDIVDQGAVQSLLEEGRFDWIINCAAYTAVDKAEVEREQAVLVNVAGPRSLAIACREHHTRLLHISTDYVFGGEESPSKEPFREDDPIHPCGVYGQTKANGEIVVREHLAEDHLILRTSWLHGVGGPNFVDTMLRLGREKEYLRIVDDQRGSPTYTGWLADVIVELVRRDARGTFHASSRGDITWLDFAQEIFLQAGIDIAVEGQTTEELGRPAPRPAFSTLNVEKLEREVARACPSWKDCVSQHLEARANA